MYAPLDVNLSKELIMHERFKNILNDLDIFAFGNPMHFKSLNNEFFGKKLSRPNQFDCTSTKTKFFMDRLQKLDSLSFSGAGMSMERWMFYDCGAMPSSILGFGIPADLASEKTRELFGITDDADESLIPLSMYIAIPTMKEGHWFGHNLCSLSSKINQYFGLGLLTKAMGITLYRSFNLFGATQWDSEALNLHAQLSDMFLLSAHTPNHSKPNSLTYYSEYSMEKIEAALSGKKREAAEFDFLMDSQDVSQQLMTQKKIEKGEIFYINGRSIKEDDKTLFPIKNA